MKQFHVYRLPGGTLVVCLQSNLVDTNTKIVAPLIPESDRFPPLKRLEPVFEIDGARYSMRTAELAAILANVASGDPVADLSDCEYEIRGALDMVFSGF